MDSADRTIGHSIAASSTCCPYLEPRYRHELAHAVLHVGPVRLLQRITRERWAPQSGA